MATVVNFTVDQGSDFDAIVTVENDDGTPYDLTGFTTASQMRKSYYSSIFTVIPVSIIAPGTTGEIAINLVPADTALVRPGRYVYDIEIYDGTGAFVRRVVQGMITISPRVTRP